MEVIETTAYEKGKIHGDTKVFPGEKLFQQTHGHHKIHRIVIYHNWQQIFGLEVDYIGFGTQQMFSGGRRVGNQYDKHTGSRMVYTLNPDEFIVNIHGRSGDIFDNIGFRTNKGRDFAVGGNGGHHFDINAEEGRHFNVFDIGIGGHLHYLKALTSPMPHSHHHHHGTIDQVNSFLNIFDVGNKHPTTKVEQEFPEGDARIRKIKVYHDNHWCFGIKIYYKLADGSKFKIGGVGKAEGDLQKEKFELEEGEYIVKIFGGAYGQIERIGMQTNFGRQFCAGGKEGIPFNFSAPPGTHYDCFEIGLGEHFEYFNAQSHPIPQKHHHHHHKPEQIEKFIQIEEKFKDIVVDHKKDHHGKNPYFQYPIPGYFVQSYETIGKFSGHSHFFDDFHDLTKGKNPVPLLSSITVYYTKHIGGIKCNYSQGNQILEGKKHIGSKFEKDEHMFAEMQLQPGEAITEISASGGHHLDYLKIVSSLGKVLEIGELKGQLHYLLPSGGFYKITGFGGAVHSGLDGLYVTYCKF